MTTVERAYGLSRARLLAATIAICAALLSVTACSSSAGKSDSSSSTTSPRAAAVTTTRPIPPGPAADVSKELTGGNGMYMGEASAPDLTRVGYVQHEYLAAGTATSYKPVGALTRDGRWKIAPAGSAPYRTRVVVREPANAADFSGNVIVEWLNVSAGVDANPDWVNIAEEIVRAGDAWVGVSAQRIGVEGGPVLVKVTGVPGSEAAGKGLKKVDPARYGSLDQPGDGYSYDIFTQVARAIRTGAGLSRLHPTRLIAAGQSQSAVAMVTYFNGVQPLTRVFDGFFVHSRLAVSLQLAPGAYADLAGALKGAVQTIFRTDQDTPIMDIQTETDVVSILNSYAVRQPDTNHFRLWEVAGTAHADAHQLGDNEKYVHCGLPINDGPMHLVAKAALRALTTWLTTGTAPVTAPRIDVIPGPVPQARRNADAIALGGIRTPPVDVPVAALSGASAPDPSTICLLLGSAKPLTATRLAELYPSRVEYRQRFEAAADAMIKAGFALPEDRRALLAFAEPSRVSG